MAIDPIKLSQELIRCPSVTPIDAGALDVLEKALTEIGFECTRLPFSEKGTPDVDNLFARLGTGAPHVCYAGHTDVVPAGDLNDWKYDPFEAAIEDGIMYGRGTSDMKCSIAAFVAAASEIKDFNGSISLLITGDEEGPAINGTVKMLKWLEENGHVPDYCIVGEPTNAEQIGDMMKVGRRGSLNGVLTVRGIQGHVAYPHLAKNPIPELIRIADILTNASLDQGNEFFDASNLEIVSIDVGNTASNVIPMEARANFNIRFNSEYSADTLTTWLHEKCKSDDFDVTLDITVSGPSFITNPGILTETVASAVKECTGLDPDPSTTGGTSDARFIQKYCPVVEFGLINKTIHKVNENAKVSDIILLKDIYRTILRKFFL